MALPSAVEVLDVDWLDKALLWQLYGNARISYQDLAKKYNITFNAIKNRVKKLEEIGVIQEYTVELSLAMLSLEPLQALIITDGTENMRTLIDQIGSHPLIRLAYRQGNRRYNSMAYVAGTKDFFELKRFLESLDTVTTVELHPLLSFVPDAPPHSKARSQGQKVTFTQSQLRVLQCLREDVRMPVNELAKQTSLTPRRTNKILNELQEGGGVHFTIRINLLAPGDAILDLYIHYDEKKTTVNEIITWFQDYYSSEFWNASQWLDEPVIAVGLIIEDHTKVGEITNIVREATFVETVDDFLVTPQTYVKMHYRDPSQHRLDELFKEAGL